MARFLSFAHVVFKVGLILFQLVYLQNAEVPTENQMENEKAKTLFDFYTRVIAYKDLMESKCYLELMRTGVVTTSDLSYISREGLVKTLLASQNQLTKQQVWNIGGTRVLEFCRGYPTFLLQQYTQKNDLGSVNEISTDNFRKNRKRRSAHYFRGRVRGQTQSQYLSYGGNNQQEGKAEAESTYDGSKAVVVSSNGMGSAQSQSSPIGCEECFGTGTQEQVLHIGRGGIKLPGYGPGDARLTQGRPGSYLPGQAAAEIQTPGIKPQGIPSSYIPGQTQLPQSTSQLPQGPPTTYVPGQIQTPAQTPGQYQIPSGTPGQIQTQGPTNRYIPGQVYTQIPAEHVSQIPGQEQTSGQPQLGPEIYRPTQHGHVPLGPPVVNGYAPGSTVSKPGQYVTGSQPGVYTQGVSQPAGQGLTSYIPQQKPISGEFIQSLPGKPGDFGLAGIPGVVHDITHKPGELVTPERPGEYVQGIPGRPGEFVQGIPGRPGEYVQGIPEGHGEYIQSTPGRPIEFVQGIPGRPGVYVQSIAGRPGHFVQTIPERPGQQIQITQKPGEYTQGVAGKPSEDIHGISGRPSGFIQGIPGRPGEFIRAPQSQITQLSDTRRPSQTGEFSGNISGDYQTNIGHGGKFSGTFSGQYSGDGSATASHQTGGVQQKPIGGTESIYSAQPTSSGIQQPEQTIKPGLLSYQPGTPYGQSSTGTVYGARGTPQSGVSYGAPGREITYGPSRTSATPGTEALYGVAGTGPSYTAASTGPSHAAPGTGLSYTIPSAGPSYETTGTGPSYTAPNIGVVPGAGSSYTGPFYLAPGTGTSYAAPSTGSSYAAPGTGTSYTAPGTKPSYAAPGIVPSYATPGTGPSYTAPSTGPSHAAPSTGTSYAAPGVGPSYASPGVGLSYTAPGTGPSYQAPGRGGPYATTGSGPSSAVPGTGFTYVSPGTGPTYAAPGSLPSYGTTGTGSSYGGATGIDSTYGKPGLGLSYASPGTGPTYGTPGTVPSYVTSDAGPTYGIPGSTTTFAASGIPGTGLTTAGQVSAQTGGGQIPVSQSIQYGPAQATIQHMPGQDVNPANLYGAVTGGADDADSQAQTSVQQINNETQASASAQGRYEGGLAQSQVSGSYHGTGSFSASAGTNDGKRGAQTEVNGGKEGATSTAQGTGGMGLSQAQVQLASESGDTLSTAQSGGYNHGSNTQVQASSKGGMADAQANGPGNTSSQAQIGFIPNNNSDDDDQKVPFRGGGTASAQSGTHSGQTQAQIQGKFRYGIKYTGAAQAASGNKESVHISRNQSTNNFGGNFPTFKPLKLSSPNNNPAPSLAAINNHTTEKSINNQINMENPSTNIMHQRNIPTSNPRENNEDYDDDYDDYEEEDEGNATEKPSTKSSKIISQTNKRQKQHIVLDPLEDIDATVLQASGDDLPDGTILQPGQIIPGFPGYQIPLGFRGRVSSSAGTRKTVATGHNSQAQSVTLKPGTGRVIYNTPVYAVSSNTHLQKGGYGFGSGYTYHPTRHQLLKSGRQYPNFVSVSKSETGSQNVYTGKKTPSVYYTQSSSCGYFTNTCIFNKGSKICIPKPKTNPDGSPIIC